MVLAHLALSPHPVARDEVADLVWPDELTASWERDLSAVVSKIRSTLDTVGLGSTVKSALGCYELQLPPGSRIDVDDAVHFLEDATVAWRVGDPATAVPAAATAAVLARRPFLPGEGGLWVERRRNDLLATRLQALDLLVEALGDGPHAQEAMRYGTEALEVDPYRETSYVQLMRLHERRGNRAEAVRVYAQCRSVLMRDLGVPPSAQTEAAYHELLEG